MNPEQLITAIRAALDETERLAREALSHPTRWHGVQGERTGTDDGVWRAGSGMDECRVEGIGITIYDEGGHSAEQARHIAANNPATVLRLVAGLREIVAEVETWRHSVCEDSWYSCSQATEAAGYEEYLSCADEDRVGTPCDCGLDQRKARILSPLARGLGIDPEED